MWSNWAAEAARSTTASHGQGRPRVNNVLRGYMALVCRPGWRISEDSMKNKSVRATDLITALSDANDPFYGDKNNIDLLFNNILICTSTDIKNSILSMINSINSEQSTYKYTYLCKLPQFFLFILLNHIGLNVYENKSSKNSFLYTYDPGYLAENLDNFIVNDSDIHIFFEIQKIPLPYKLYPTDDSNSKSYIEKQNLEKNEAFTEVFDCEEINAEIERVVAMTPQSIDEYYKKLIVLDKLKAEKNKILQGIIPQTTNSDANTSLDTIPRQHFIQILEALSEGKKKFAQLLKKIGFTLEEIGHLLREPGEIDGTDANRKRAYRLLSMQRMK